MSGTDDKEKAENTPVPVKVGVGEKASDLGQTADAFSDKPVAAKKGAGASPEGSLSKLYKDNVFYGNDMACLKRGSKQKEKIEFLQNELESAGLLAEGAISETAKGIMKGTTTTAAVSELQKLMKAAGANIQVEEKENAVVFNEAWSALQAVREAGGVEAFKDPAKAAAIVVKYEEIKGDNMKYLLSLNQGAEPNFAAVDPTKVKAAIANSAAVAL